MNIHYYNIEKGLNSKYIFINYIKIKYKHKNTKFLSVE